MRHPFWLVNSIALLLFVSVMCYVFLSKKRIPVPVEFEPDYVAPLKETTPTIDLNKIYSNDLFGTTPSQTAGPAQPEPSKLKPIPQPPAPVTSQPLAKPVLQFLEPLSITLKGIMIVGDEKNNTAIIEDATSKESQNYRVGDKIQDGLLIRILKHKVVLIRSNGQQETLFVNPKDAQLEQSVRDRQNWSDVVQQIADTHYAIDPHSFVVRVRNLSQFIDMLNLSTVYKQGKSIGCRLGSIETDSLGAAMGLSQGDIITTINGVPATTTDNRLQIYQDIISGVQAVEVNVLRAGADILFTYSVSEIITPEQTKTDIIHAPVSEREIRSEKRKIFEEQHKLAPTIKSMQAQEKKDMMSHGRTPRAHARRNKGVLSQTVHSERKPYDPHA